MYDEDGRTRTRVQALWLEKGTQRAAHARTGGGAHARGVECAGPALPPSPSILRRVRVRAQARFPMDEATARAYGRVMHTSAVSCEPGPLP
jgi:hypothetical protein